VIPPRTLAGWLREWLEVFPEKVLFATDGYPFTDSLAGRNRRTSRAATSAIARDRAVGHAARPRGLARARAGDRARVLHDNAAKLYGIP